MQLKNDYFKEFSRTWKYICLHYSGKTSKQKHIQIAKPDTQTPAHAKRTWLHKEKHTTRITRLYSEVHIHIHKQASSERK